MISCIQCDLKSDATRKLSQDQLSLLNTECGQKVYSEKEAIFTEGQACKHIVFLRKGIVKIHIETQSTNGFIYSIVKAPGYIGMANLFTDHPNITSATCLVRTEACLIPKSIFLDFIRTNHEFALQVIRQISKDKLEFFRHIAIQQQKNLNGRVAAALIYLSENIFESREFVLPITRTELAQYVGSTRESLTRCLSDFHKSGIVSIHLKHIKIEDMNRLIQIREKG